MTRDRKRSEARRWTKKIENAKITGTPWNIVLDPGELARPFVRLASSFWWCQLGTCVHTHTHTQTYIYAYTHIYIHIYILSDLHLRFDHVNWEPVYTHTHTHIHARRHTHTHTRIHTHTHTCTPMHAHMYTDMCARAITYTRVQRDSQTQHTRTNRQTCKHTTRNTTRTEHIPQKMMHFSIMHAHTYILARGLWSNLRNLLNSSISEKKGNLFSCLQCSYCSSARQTPRNEMLWEEFEWICFLCGEPKVR